MIHFFYKLWPPICLICQKTCRQLPPLCNACVNDLPWLTQACQQCANPIHNDHSTLCGNCLSNTPYFDNTIALFNYNYPVDKFITQLKFHHKLNYSKLLSQLFIHHIKNLTINPLPDLMISVPLHNQRLRERGFNQALQIAKPIAKYFKIPLAIKTCRRIKNTLAQSALPGKYREENLKNAFAIAKPITANHVVIFDDVMTTGHTANELSKILKQAGVLRVDVWCCARVGNTR